MKSRVKNDPPESPCAVLSRLHGRHEESITIPPGQVEVVHDPPGVAGINDADKEARLQ